jgi:hypothetical protein
VSLHIEAVANVLNHRQVDILPRGELFIDKDFLDHFFSKYRGQYIDQLKTVAQCLRLSVIGVELDTEWSRHLLVREGYKKLDEYFTVGCVNGPIARFIENDGFFNAMLSIKNNPSLFSEVGTQLLGEMKEKVRLSYANGVKAIAIADDIAGNKGLLFPISFFMDRVLPIYKEIAAIIKENGLFAFFHSDGETRRVIDPLIRGGYDCIHPVESQAGLNLYDLKKEFGESISFMGHIDMITWSKEQIDKEISLAENEFKTGGLILGSTCGLSMETLNDKLSLLYPQWERRGLQK